MLLKLLGRDMFERNNCIKLLILNDEKQNTETPNWAIVNTDMFVYFGKIYIDENRMLYTDTKGGVAPKNLGAVLYSNVTEPHRNVRNCFVEKLLRFMWKQNITTIDLKAHEYNSILENFQTS